MQIQNETLTKKFSLISDGDAPADSTQLAVGVAAGAKVLSGAQKQFNKHVAAIESLIREIEQWQMFLPVYRRAIADQIVPIEMQLRKNRVAIVRLLDQHMDSKALSHTQRKKTRDLLSNLLDSLLDQQETAELIALHDKYSDTSFKEYQEQDSETIRKLAEELFGIELDDAASPDDLMQQFHQKADERETERKEKRERRKTAKKPSKKQAAEAATVQDATRAVRDIYRKLASELHPDREQNPQRRAELTELMQQANRAYDDSDLLTLLKLQMQIQQLDPQSLTQLAETRLNSCNTVLRSQSERLQRELDEFKVPFSGLHDGSPHKLSPQAVQQALESDVKKLQKAAQELEQDLQIFEDVHQFKSWLKDYRIETADDF